MRRSFFVFLLLAVVMSGTAAFATHPHEQGQGCGQRRVNELWTSPDGETHVCVYDPEFELWYWRPTDPPDPDDEVVHTRVGAALAYGDWHMLLAKTEWIRGALKTGTDVYVRHPQTSPSFRSTGEIAAFSRLWHWGGSSWNWCRDSSWRYTTFVTESLVPTFNWGSGPCGSGFYGSEAVGAHLAAGSWLYSGPSWSGYIYTYGFQGLAAAEAAAPAAPTSAGPGADEKRKAPPIPPPKKIK